MLWSLISYSEEREESSLFADLALVDSIDKELSDRLPFIYNYSFVGGYFNMPSARMNKDGTIAVGGASVPPYAIVGVNFQMFSRIELSANYRIFRGVEEPNFGKEGFGDDAERIGNIKIGILIPEDQVPYFPSIVFGADDFIGTRRFNAQYVAVTQELTSFNLEATLGFGRHRFDGFFGGVAWTPLRQTSIPVLKNITLIAEYDCINYKKHISEHFKGRKVNSRINGGFTYILGDVLQVSLSSVRGTKLAGSASLRYPLGDSKGLFPKIDDPLKYTAPIDTEPLGVTRPKEDFVHELAMAFSDQGLDLYSVYLSYNKNSQKELWLKFVNNRYRDENEVRRRLQHILASLIPSDIVTITAVLEADALPCQAYRFRREDLERYRLGIIGEFELETLAPMREAVDHPDEYESIPLFHRKKRIWTFTARPSLISYFGSVKGKFKYSLGIIGAPEGYFWNEVYYKFQFRYSIVSSFADLGAQDRANPSQIINVRTDTIKYYQGNTFSMEQGFIQKGWNIGKGFFARLAGGYFEAAYGGGALEFLYYPVNSNWAVGIEGAGLLKRKYHGVGFTTRIRKLNGHIPHREFFVGYQYFANLYYDFKPLQVDVRIQAGQFLARDFGARFELGRYFKSGLRFGLWYTITNGHDKVNGKTYFDKGFVFSLPLDFFLKQSSRQYITYAMSAWLRDVGATAATGKPLYLTLSEERYLP